MGPEYDSGITSLHLDHNPLKSEGIEKLAEGLSMNKKLTICSLKHVGIDYKGTSGLIRIMIYIDSNLKELDLEGN